MIRSARWLLVLLSSVLLCSAAKAQTINAASCNVTDVAAALGNIVTDGTTVVIPPGDCNWTSPLTYAQTKSFTLQGAGAISYSASSPSGTGSDVTTIENGLTSGSSILTIISSSGKSFRMTGIHFATHAGNSNKASNGWIVITGSSTSVRVDHNHFDQLNNVDLGLYGCVQGVADHNQFDGSYADENMIRFQSGTCNGDASNNGDGSWADSSHWGTGQFMFTEMNTFRAVPSTNANHIFAFDCSRGGRAVFRFNIMAYHTLVVTHGTGNSTDPRGCRAMEFYGNTATYSTNPAQDNAGLIQAESGGYLWWANTTTGYYGLFQADIDRTNKVTYVQNPTPNGWGYCGTTYGPSNWDGNQDSTGYPCLDGIGRGGGDRLSGLFPIKCDQTTGCTTFNGTWPHQALDPVYVFSNNFTSVPQRQNNYWSNFPPPIAIAENRDYYLELPNINESGTFNGSAGVGCGPSSSPTCAHPVARPATCTTGVGYWEMDEGNWNQSGNGFGNGQLYVCTAPNTWTVYYTPFTYPHPLDGNTPTAIPPNQPNAQPH